MARQRDRGQAGEPPWDNVVYRHLGGTPEQGMLSCGFLRKTPEKSQLGHVIPYYSCFVLLRGGGEYWDETGLRVPLAAGSVVQRLPDRVHSTRVDRPADAADGACWLEFYVSFGRGFYEAMRAVGLLDGAPVGRAAPQPPPAALQRLLGEMRAAPDTALFPVLLEAQRIASLLAGPSAPADPAGTEPLLARARAMLEGNLDRELSPRQVAARLSMGYESFRKRFAAETGMAPGLYRLEKKMMTARLMLLGGRTVKEVAASLGYGDAYAFSKQFKRHTGMPPGRYVRESTQKPDK